MTSPAKQQQQKQQQLLPTLHDAPTLASATAGVCALLQSPVAHKYAVQFVFLFTGVFSTCAAQFVFYQGAGDQKAMLLPLCNYIGIMLVGLIPLKSSGSSSSAGSSSDAKTDRLAASASSSSLSSATASSSSSSSSSNSGFDDPADDDDDGDEPERTHVQHAALAPADVPDAWDLDCAAASTTPLMAESMELTRRQAGAELHDSASSATASLASGSDSTSLAIEVTPSTVYCSLSQLQLCIFVSVALDFAGCIFSNIGLSMAGSGLYQVVYSSVICWSALFSRFILQKRVSKEEWMGIALVTFGLAFSALGSSSDGRNSYVVLMGCLNTLIGAAFYGGNYVAGEYTLKLPERPSPKELCLKLGVSCVAVIAVYQSIFVLPEWHDLVTKPIAAARGSTASILTALIGYTLSQLAHGVTYFMMLGSSGAVTTGIMQSLRAVCVFAISSLLYCSHQESQCFDTRRGVATLIVVSGVLFYSWAKSQVRAPAVPPPSRRKQKMVAGKNYVV